MSHVETRIMPDIPLITQAEYLEDVARAYAYLESPTILTETSKQRTLQDAVNITLGAVFFHVATIEAQSGQAPVNIIGNTIMDLLNAGVPLDNIIQAQLPTIIAERLAVRAASFHNHRGINEIAFGDLIDMNRNIFDGSIDHVFDILERLPDATRINHTQGVSYHIDGEPDTEKRPRPRSETAPAVSIFLTDAQNLQIATALFHASSQALLSPDGRRAKRSLLNGLEGLSRQRAAGTITEHAVYVERQMDIRRTFWERTHPLIYNAVTDVRGITPQQQEAFAHNASFAYIQYPQLPPPHADSPTYRIPRSRRS